MSKFLAIAIFLLAVLLAAAGAAGAYYRIVLSFVGFLLVAGGLLLASLGFFVTLIALFRSEGKAGLAMILLLELPCIGLAGYGIWLGSQHPPINDITTDMVNVPKFIQPHYMATVLTGQQHLKGIPEMERGYNPEFPARQKSLFPGLMPSMQKLPIDVAFGVVKKTVTEAFRDWKIVMEDPKNFILQAEVESDFFHFVDDIVVRVTPAPNDPTLARTDIRSRSRFGQGDFDKNAERITRFLVEYRTRANAAAAGMPQTPATPALVPPAAPVNGGKK